MELIIGVITFFNFIVLLHKFQEARWADLAVDASILFILSFLFAGSISGLVIAMTASFLTSLYLLKYPPQFSKAFEAKEVKKKYSKTRTKVGELFDDNSFIVNDILSKVNESRLDSLGRKNRRN
jgi:hypothetical protein